jgi:hypothetical protein
MTDELDLEIENPSLHSDQLKNEVVVTINQEDVKIPLESLGLTMDSSSSQVLNAVRATIEEVAGVAYSEIDVGYTVRKALNSATIYVYPKPVAG